jgi:putative membrane protein
MMDPAGGEAPVGGGFLAISERALSVLVYSLSLVVVLLVAILMLTPQLLRFEGLNVSGLPGFHASLNGTTAFLLVLGVLQIKRGRVDLHRNIMVAAFTLSSIFLISYVIYHSQAPSVRFGGEGLIRGIYFFILITHVVLATIILPLALFTVSRAIRGELGKHRRIARVTFPLWLYVTVTGVLVYLMMVPYYPY